MNNKCHCGNNKKLKTIYYGRIRSGSFGKLTKDKFRILNCNKCDLKFLEKPKKKNFL